MEVDNISSSRDMDVDENETEAAERAMQEYIIQEIVVQHDNDDIDSPHDIGDPTADHGIIFCVDDNQSSILFQTAADSVSHDVESDSVDYIQETITQHDDQSVLPDSTDSTDPHDLANIEENDPVIQTAFPTNLQVSDLILHNESSTDSMILGHGSSILHSESNVHQIQSVIFPDSTSMSSNPSYMESSLQSNLTIQQDVDNVAGIAQVGQPIILQYALPASNDIVSQGVPIIQLAQSSLVHEQAVLQDQDIYETIANKHSGISVSNSIQSVPQFQPIMIMSQNETSVDKQPVFIQGGNTQNMQLIQQLLALIANGEATITHHKPSTGENKDFPSFPTDDETCHVYGQTCRLCSQFLVPKSLLTTSSTQTDDISALKDDLASQTSHLPSPNDLSTESTPLDNCSTQNDDCSTQNDDFSTQNNDFSTQNNDFSTQNHDFSTQNDDFSTQNQDFSTQNQDFSTHNDDFSIQNQDLSTQSQSHDFSTQNDDFSTQNDDYSTNHNDLSTHNHDLATQNGNSFTNSDNIIILHTDNTNFNDKTIHLDTAIMAPVMGDNSNDSENLLQITESFLDVPISTEHSLTDPSYPVTAVISDDSNSLLTLEDHVSYTMPKQTLKRRRLTVIKVGDTCHNCKYCANTFHRLSELMIHVKTKHPDQSNIDDVSGSFNKLPVSFTVQKASDTRYICDVCSEEFTNFYSLRVHCNSAHQDAIKCDLCGIVQASDEKLLLHIDTYHSALRTQCKKCLETFDEGLKLKKHRCYYKPVVFKCELCDEIFKDQNRYKCHVLAVHSSTVNRLQCQTPGCGYVSSSPAALIAHMRTHTGFKPFSCPECHKRFTFKHILKRHLECHNDKKKYQCVECGKRYKDRTSLKAHFVIHSGKYEHVCDICDEKFLFPYGLKKHNALKHGQDADSYLFMCDYCGKNFTTKNSLICHTRLHTGERPFVCPHCDKGFIEKRTLQFHISVHSQERPYQCNDCGKCFKREDCLKAHLKLHYSLDHKCPDCDKIFSSQNSLINHQHLHSGKKPYICDVCAEAFATSGRLKKHSITHTDHRPYVCTNCPKQFREKYVLTVHMRTHGIDDQHHECDICHQTFRQRSTLNVHKRRHTGVQPFVCTTCETRFSTSSSLRRHIRIHTGDCPYKCKLCESAFRLASSLKTHISRQHKATPAAVTTIPIIITSQ